MLKMADQERCDFCVVFTMSLCSLRFKKVSKLAISNHTAVKLTIETLKSYLKVSCKYELHIFPNTKVSVANYHGKNYVKVLAFFQEFFQGGKIYCYANFFFMQLFSDQISGEGKVSRGANCQGQTTLVRHLLRNGLLQLCVLLEAN